MAVLHPHVGGWTETEHEVRTVLYGIGRELLAFGPDTGHMSWAGMDVVGILREYAGRVLREYAGQIVGVQVKDTFSAGIDRAKALDLDYRDATRPGGIGPNLAPASSISRAASRRSDRTTPGTT